jgi:hypothetical protein
LVIEECPNRIHKCLVGPRAGVEVTCGQGVRDTGGGGEVRGDFPVGAKCGSSCTGGLAKHRQIAGTPNRVA